ncbi:MAG: YcaQ family DNA glycosylase [Rhodocyclaceae bacterium]|nr:YcaQ family DNA glycosylase [Rhodocyclaceae bacterium]
MPVTLAQLRRHAIARSLFKPTTLGRAIDRLGFVQADPIRAPARAQDLILRQRVKDYRAGDLDRRYARLALEEDHFVNYGFLPRATQALMHPRSPRRPWPAEREAQAGEVLAWMAGRRAVHPREVDARFAHGTATTWFGGTARASTQLLDDMHYRGLLRVARREGGTRLYTLRQATPPPTDPQAAFDALIDVIVGQYAPLPAASLGQLLSLLRVGVPQWAGVRHAAQQRARQRLAHARIDGIDWLWPADERLRRGAPHETVRLLAPFDPLTWDRRRFELFWGWAYRFEAYTPPAKRKLGYYALPMLWRDHVVGWANVTTNAGRVRADVGYAGGAAPGDPLFHRELEAELARLEAFLQVREG